MRSVAAGDLHIRNAVAGDSTRKNGPVSPETVQLKRELGLFSAVNLIVGVMIGDSSFLCNLFQCHGRFLSSRFCTKSTTFRSLVVLSSSGNMFRFLHACAVKNSRGDLHGCLCLHL
jgi:hypothetical protein